MGIIIVAGASFVEVHGGRIHAENRAGGGARFMFSLSRGVPPMVAEEPGST
ncbi:hypothetical protein [Accumulibacter sp.]|uniref:hypothetical protein n=1 Tax=Accumulibacter sp. TaxID=2053492 RepID=UPI002C940B75|nr:hypothetical protein [Accumulibacter sp.]HNC21447.1 hypothetical protein [Accumulibacter sp.]